jgi:hypothetical protein
MLHHTDTAGQEIGCFLRQKRGKALCHMCQEVGHYSFEFIQIGELSAEHDFKDVGADFGQVKFGVGSRYRELQSLFNS